MKLSERLMQFRYKPDLLNSLIIEELIKEAQALEGTNKFESGYVASLGYIRACNTCGNVTTGKAWDVEE